LLRQLRLGEPRTNFSKAKQAKAAAA
jgi:hypothetical protein